ncbi:MULTISPECIES: BlaI/MecI/CopY family transcriptional regulator [Brevibacillus]|jgi:predicted transcriptional regulator|uniref:BlaI/MecI/CopY family transcriptional regulator n=1 Tax=Brevibacillus thermoruber TaxID=33942 RepID=A0A9X3TQS9_9BACL|nr:MULTISPECIES: BlaI/MecI/CopY family transcriptional regulator [Bacillales]MDA5109064.1 BlaI/MecI/CopY family transcriptional regulator [Brevibacillus thermoruber]MDT3416428.1 putative transcriptional regulator [Brevibacillus aydinogluensis]UFJ62751.1 BlaI/MecI/CopY family transcriptional regulator [Anoxybacillus sediminis]UYZ13082.1 BlaI/MecI/CopY family transcriptional regulator [Brevibacillus sp. WF146]
MKILTFKCHERGLNRFFGPLEAKVMDVLWSGSEMSIKDVQKKLEREKHLNFNTVMTVINRLVEKGVLVKRTEGRTSLYRPVLSREEFMETQSRELTHELMDEFGPLVVNHMLDALDEVDQELLDKLEEKLKQWKKET